MSTPPNQMCVFCGSAPGNNPGYAAAARELGRELAARGCGLVWGGGRVGLMGEVAAAALAAGGRVLGVIPHALAAKEIAFAGATELVVVNSMHERKALMADRSTAFIALPGGFGTLDELFEILTWAQLGIHQKPVGLLNLNGFFGHILSWADHAVSEGFLKARHRSLLLTGTEVPALLDAVLGYRPPPPVAKWVHRDER